MLFDGANLRLLYKLEEKLVKANFAWPKRQIAERIDLNLFRKFHTQKTYNFLVMAKIMS